MVILFHNFKLNEVWDGDGIIYYVISLAPSTVKIFN